MLVPVHILSGVGSVSVFFNFFFINLTIGILKNALLKP